MKLRLSGLSVIVLLCLWTSVFAQTEPVWIDVRSALEHKVDSIEGDLRVTHTEIVSEVEKLFPDKNVPIKLYCRSGGRAGKAAAALAEAGYQNVENMGGINDARKVRKLTN